MSPETDFVAAYLAGQVAAGQGAIRTANPYTTDASYLVAGQFAAWNLGFDGAIKDMNSAAFNTVQPPAGSGAGGSILMPPVRITLSAAETAASFTTPKQAVPARPGYTHTALSVVLYHAAGVAFTIAGVTGFGCLVGGALNCGTGAPTGFLDSALEQCIKMRGPGNGSNLFSGIDVKAGANLPLMFGCLGANPAGGGTLVTQVEITYEDTFLG